MEYVIKSIKSGLLKNKVCFRYHDLWGGVGSGFFKHENTYFELEIRAKN